MHRYFWGGVPDGGVTVIGNNCRLSPVGIRVIGQSNRIEGNSITQYSQIGIDLTKGKANYFAKNLLQDNGTSGAISWVGESDDIDGGRIDPALSNIILPSYVP